jgi:hypothetical protein
MARKNFAATGSFRPRTVLARSTCSGFSSQLVFNTFHNRRLRDWEHGDDLDLAYGAARAHNRGMIDFCSVDRAPAVDALRAARRLRPRHGQMRTRAVGWAPPALLVASGCPKGTRRATAGLDPVWRVAAGGDDPDRVHVGGTGDLDRQELLRQRAADPARLPRRRGELPSVDYMAIPFPPMQTLATMLFDGVFDRFPSCRSASSSRGRSGCRAGCARWRARSRRS